MKKVIAFILSLVMISMVIVPMASADGTFYHVFRASAEYEGDCDYIAANPILLKLHEDAGYMWYVMEIEENNWCVFCMREDGFNVLIKDVVRLADDTIFFPKKLDGMKLEGILAGDDVFYELTCGGYQLNAEL